MSIHPRAGQAAASMDLCDPAAIIRKYYNNVYETIQYSVCGYRGSSLQETFQESHVLAVAQAICDYRQRAGQTGPLFLGRDTHAVSGVTIQTLLEVFTANGIEVQCQEGELIPTPVISHAILEWNRNNPSHVTDGVIVTCSHNPPEDGGIKYNGPNGGAISSEAARWIEDRANMLLTNRNKGVLRANPKFTSVDFIGNYVNRLSAVVDLRVIALSGLRIGVDVFGGTAGQVWKKIAQRYGLDITVFNDQYDPTFRFLSLDYDGRIRMDCGSRHVMLGVLSRSDGFDLMFANDTDADRYGIVSEGEIISSQQTAAVLSDYCCRWRPLWNPVSVIGKSLVTTDMIDRVAKDHNHPLYESPLGFKWFADGLYTGKLCFGCEESAGAGFLDRNGQCWTTDKDGIVSCLLAMECKIKSKKGFKEYFFALQSRLGHGCHLRNEWPVSKEVFQKISGAGFGRIDLRNLMEAPIHSMATASVEGEPFHAIKIRTSEGWLVVTPNVCEGTVCCFAESFVSESHLAMLKNAAYTLMERLLQ